MVVVDLDIIPEAHLVVQVRQVVEATGVSSGYYLPFGRHACTSLHVMVCGLPYFGQ